MCTLHMSSIVLAVVLAVITLPAVCICTSEGGPSTCFHMLVIFALDVDSPCTLHSHHSPARLGN